MARQAAPVRAVQGRADLSPSNVADDDEAIAEEAESIAAVAPADAEPGESTESAPAAATTSRVSAMATPAAAVVPDAANGPAAAPRRRIERLSQAAPQATRAGRGGRGSSNTAAMFQPLDSEDAAIPFDIVPYVPADLRRILVIALMMVGLIVIAAIVVTHVVH